MQLNQRHRILAVDDTAANLYLLKTALEEEGYEVDTASNGSLALAKIEASPSPPSLVLLDVIMPDIDGLEVTRRIRQNPIFAKMPILIVSGSDEACIAKALNLGANDFIRKPFQIDQLLAKIHQFCD
jgi:CheY-like chemotaxis protein